jgi:uncharacterized membrane-anchored protein
MKAFLKAIGLGLFLLALLANSSQAADPPMSDYDKAILSLNWVKPPNSGDIANRAKIDLMKDNYFLGEEETKKFLKINGNPESPGNYTLFNPLEGWFAIFSFSPEGYVKDDEKIDADALLKVLKENNAKGIEERKKQGLPLLYLDGWYTPPHYDKENKRLEWATKIHDKDNNIVVNYTTRVLGRNGYMNVLLVSEPSTLDRDIKSFKTALKKFDFNNGERYAEWREGDKVAAYGLGALVVGGAAAAVASKGGFKFLWAIALAAFAGLAGIFKKFFGKKD